jgi:hypothetical protein
MRLLFIALLMTSSLIIKTADCQALYGSINGTVTDSTGAVVPGATVTATQTETNISRTETTNGSGFYMFASLPAGTYRIAIARAGFKDFQTQNFGVEINAAARIDAVLTIGTAKETVTVSAESAQLQTDRTDVNTEIPSEDFQNLPQPTRTYEGLLGAVAGVGTPNLGNGLGINNPDRSMLLEANGTSLAATDVRIEGVPDTENWVPYYSTLVPSVEAIQTVSMVTGSAEAEQTLASGATINVQLKSGTNQFHGEVYDFHMDRTFAARPYFSAPNSPIPGELDNDLGATLGGPIIRNKLFFFGSFEGDFGHQGYLSTMTVPTQAMLTGDFTDTGTTLFDPTSATDAAGDGKKSYIAETGSNKLPAISANVQPLVTLLQKVAPTTTTNFTNNLMEVVAQPSTLKRIDTKFDWKASDKLSFMGRFNDHPFTVQNVQPWNPEGILRNGDDDDHGETYGVTVAATYVATPHFVINGSWGITRAVQILTVFDDNEKYGATVLGIAGTNLEALPEGGGMPQFNINGYSGYGYNYPYLDYDDPTVNYDASASWIKGRHTLKFGTVNHDEHMNHLENSPDQFSFNGGSTSSSAAGAAQPNQFNSFADFLLGDPNYWQNSLQPFTWSRLITHQYSAYVMDTWQASRKLTVNAGVGWAYLPVPTHGSYGLENYIESTNTYEVCGYGGVPMNCGIDAGKGVWSPNLGFAYRPFNGFVVRGGAAIGAEQFNVGRDLMYNYPEDIGYSQSTANQYAPVLNPNVNTTGIAPLAGSLSEGVPTLPIPNYKNGIIPLPVGASVYFLPQRLVHGYVESYNLTIEKQVRTWLAQVGFVGNESIHQHMRYNVNYGMIGGGGASDQLYAEVGTTGMTEISSLMHSKYDSLQATLTRSFANGFQLKGTYTYSKWLGLCCDNSGFGGLATTPIPQYMRLNYAPMGSDQRQIFNLSGIAQSPFGKGKKYVQTGAGAAVLGGWQLGAVAFIHSGFPFGIGAPGNSLNAPGSNQRADQVKPHVAIKGGTQEYFDVTAYAEVNAARFGTSGDNSVYGPGAKNVDASLFRTFTLPEHISAQFRIESMNLTNTPHFANPGTWLGSVSAFNPDGTIAAGANLNGFGQITGTSANSRPADQRYFRLGMKILF